jgi:hypothetical protein
MPILANGPMTNDWQRGGNGRVVRHGAGTSQGWSGVAEPELRLAEREVANKLSFPLRIRLGYHGPR